MGAGIIELDLHGLNCEQAKTKIDRTIAAADGSVYMIRLIHGYHGGTQILNMIPGDEYRPRTLTSNTSSGFPDGKSVMQGIIALSLKWS
jgi:hypothetical protein